MNTYRLEHKGLVIEDIPFDRLSVQLLKQGLALSDVYTSWILLSERLPADGQKVDLWVVPDDAEKSCSVSWTWEKQDDSSITINGHKVTHWVPFSPPIFLQVNDSKLFRCADEDRGKER